MTENKSKNRRIVSNSFFLTVRMLFLMFISFYTSRVVLDKLGFVDYGINSVVGGLTSMFAFFRSSLSNVTQRYLNVELGKDNIDGAHRIFCQHQTLYIIISVFVVFAAETLGLWFFYNNLVIPAERYEAAFWVYQFMVVSLVVTLLSVVYDSAIVAHENFKIYAYIGIFEGVSKLGIALLLSIISFDRLITFALLLFLLSIFVRLFYTIFCQYHYKECHFHFDFNRQAFKDAFGLIGWNTLGTAVFAINSQGIDILLNIFFGPIVNAAKSISSHISSAVMIFTNSFYASIRPQLTKSYAAHDTEYMLRLFYQSSKYGFLILWLVCLPTMMCIDFLLDIWLKDVPAYTSSFAILVMCYALVNVLNDPIWSLALAVGRLKWYIIIGSGVFLLTFPISYVFLRMGSSPESVFIINTSVRAVYVVVVLHLIQSYVPITKREYMTKVLFPITMVVISSGGLCVLCNAYFPEFYLRWIIVAIFCALITLICIWTIGLSKNERCFLYKMLYDKLCIGVSPPIKK